MVLNTKQLYMKTLQGTNISRKLISNSASLRDILVPWRVGVYFCNANAGLEALQILNLDQCLYLSGGVLRVLVHSEFLEGNPNKILTV